MNKKIIILIVIVLIILLIPFKNRLKDGGSIQYKAIIYDITKVHRIIEKSSTGYEDGLIIKVLGFQIYNVINTYVNTDSNLVGRWSSKDNSVIKIVKEYSGNTPIYDNNNIVGYWLDISENGKYIIYYLDIDDKSRSDFNYINNMVEKGKYNIDNKDNSIIYFNPISNDNSFIWTCHINDLELSNCNNYATDFIKQ